jgi:hypothetical protein
MKIHHLKTIQPWFDYALSGRKTFEVRKNDRDFTVGDIIILHEYDPHRPSEREIGMSVKVILDHEDVKGIQPGYCVMGVSKIDLIVEHTNCKEEIMGCSNDEEVRKPISQNVLNMLRETTDLACEVKSQVRTKLLSICNEEPDNRVDTEATALPYWPPLYGSIREYCIDIQNSLEEIKEVLSRVEL